MKRWRISIYLTSWAISFNQESTLYRRGILTTRFVQRTDRTAGEEIGQRTGKTENRQEKEDRTENKQDRAQTEHPEGRRDREQAGQRTGRTENRQDRE